MTDNRVRVPDPALMRRAGGRMILALVFILVLATPITAWGVVLIAGGEISGLPLAVGGAVLAVAAVVLTLGSLGVRRSLDGGTVTRESIRTARRTTTAVRAGCLVAVVGLVIFGLARAAAGELWSLMTAIPVSGVLFLFAHGAGRLAKAQQQSLGPAAR